MKQRFEEILAECLEAVTTGQRTVEECLSLYPSWRDRLEPLLRLSYRLGQASFPEADLAFQEAARERFLAAARARAAVSRSPRRFLPALPALSLWSWRPVLPPNWRRAAATMAAAFLIGFFGFSSFVVASAGDSLPGDWRYPVKRLTERTRLAFTFGEDARRDYRIGLAEERLHEVRELASQERQIGESVLRQITETTEPLVRALEPDSVPPDQIERISDLTAEQQDTLDRVAPLVKENAVDELEEAMVVSSEGHEKAVQALETALSEAKPPEGVSGATTPGAGTPTAGTNPTTTPVSGLGPTAVATPTPVPGASATPLPQPTSVPGEATPTSPEPTPQPGEPTPEAPLPTPTPAAPERRATLLPDDTTAGLQWNLLTIGNFSLRVPADGSAEWTVSTLMGVAGESILVGHSWSGGFDARIAVQVSTGEASIQVLVEGVLRQVSPEEVRSLVSGPIADVILHVLESINAGP
jgi:Domain of unknown function (DUF5667)